MKRYSPTGALFAFALLSACGAAGAGSTTDGPARAAGGTSANVDAGAESVSGKGVTASSPSAMPTGAAEGARDRSGASASGSGAATPARPTKKLTIPEARRYMLALVNRDRATQGLPPVELDEGPPTRAGQRHAEDMAKRGFLGHWGSDGSVPEQRHTEAGGADMVLENASCFTDERTRELDASALIDPKAIEHAESLFFDEVPPNDGHRRNILKPGHTHVGIGIAQPRATPTELPTPCFSQEFVDRHAAYVALPRRAKVGQKIRVEATASPRVTLTGVGLARIAAPTPITTSELNKRRSYPVPKPYQMYWGPGFKTPIEVQIDGPRLGVEVPLSDRAQPGMYMVSVWGKYQGKGDHAMIGLRTILVE